MFEIIKKVYYLFRPFIPLRVRWFLQRQAARRIDGNRSSPTWPIPDAPHTGSIDRWPNDTDFAFIITHDVETQFGLQMIKTVCDVEKALDLKSAWNIVPNLYEIDNRVMEYLSSNGMEIGVHDWNHDGKLFSNRQIFLARVEKINQKFDEWNAAGFRAGMAYHNDDWMDDLKCSYDSSYYDTDPYQPMGGGCRYIHPFMLSRSLILPYTMPQDHVLFIQKASISLPLEGNLQKDYPNEPFHWILDQYYKARNSGEKIGKRLSGGRIRLSGIDIWKLKAKWLVENRGMVLLITHPDYLCHPALFRRNGKAETGWLADDDRDLEEVRRMGIMERRWRGSLLEQYAALLHWIKREYESRYWQALPRDVALFYRENVQAKAISNTM